MRGVELLVLGAVAILLLGCQARVGAAGPTPVDRPSPSATAERRVRIVTPDGVELRGLHIRPADAGPVETTIVVDGRMPSVWSDPLPRRGGGTDVRLSMSGDFALDRVLTDTGGDHLVLDTASLLTGRLVDPRGQPVANCPVIVERADRDPNGSGTTYLTREDGQKVAVIVRGRMAYPADQRGRLSSITDDRGRFAFVGLREDVDYRLAYPASRWRWRVDDAAVRRGQDVVLAMHSGMVRVRLLDANGDAELQPNRDRIRVRWVQLGGEPARKGGVRWAPEPDALTLWGEVGSTWRLEATTADGVLTTRTFELRPGEHVASVRLPKD